MRLLGIEGEQLGIVKTLDAIRMAEEGEIEIYGTLRRADTITEAEKCQLKD